MPAKKPAAPRGETPDVRPLTKIQAKRLAEIVHVDTRELVGKPLLEVHKKLEFHLDPELLLLRRVCGRVVKKDPATGVLQPVPNATVHVEDTDLSFMGYCPHHWPWMWCFPLTIRREQIAVTTTDACGEFCVWVPRWELDWIWRWRHARLCFPMLYRPRVRDLLERIETELVLRKRPFPIPDPGPLALRLRDPRILMQARDTLEVAVADRLEDAIERLGPGASSQELDALLDLPLPSTPPPLPAELRKHPSVGRPWFHAASRVAADAEETAAWKDAEFPELATSLPAKSFERLDLSRYFGPFRRCVDVHIGVWTPFLDVPDITFRVTQDVDGDGTEEEIYDEGFFDVRWNAGPIDPVTLEASAIALSVPSCHGPDIDPTGATDPQIRTIGLMPVEAPMFDIATGYGRQVNRPKPRVSDLDPLGEAPFWRALQLHGIHRVGGATFYRVVYSYGGNAEQPFLGLEWHAPRLGAGPPFHIVPDGDGWYPILPAADLVFPHWLLHWESWRLANGWYSVRLQVAGAAKTVLASSDPVALWVDNSRPSGGLSEVQWTEVGTGRGGLLPLSCGIIRRTAGHAIDLDVSYQASAEHFRDAVLSASSCDGAALEKRTAAETFSHWHTDTSDNAWSGSATFRVPAGFPEGAYTIALDVNGRAFNPAGGDSGPSANWNYDWAYSWIHPRWHFAVVNL